MHSSDALISVGIDTTYAYKKGKDGATSLLVEFLNRLVIEEMMFVDSAKSRNRKTPVRRRWNNVLSVILEFLWVVFLLGALLALWIWRLRFGHRLPGF